MKGILHTAVFTLCLSFISVCNAQPAASGVHFQNSAHNSRNSLNGDGIYKRMVPCADCEGIQTTLILNRKMHYTLRTRYLGRSEK